MSRIGHNVRRVFIGQSDTAVGAVAAELAFDFEEANCVLLIGAGASAGPPSNVPLATSLMLELRRALWKSVLPFVRSHQLPATARESAKAILKEARLERILDALQETHGPEAIHRFLDALDAEQWNQTHALIASLATSGRLPVCITLNFDCLIEKSIQAHGGGVTTECPLKDNAGFETGGDGALIKARHGGDRSEVEGMLDEAERIWSASDGFVPSGLLRIFLFRRFLKLRGMIATIRDLARLRRLTRANRT